MPFISVVHEGLRGRLKASIDVSLGSSLLNIDLNDCSLYVQINTLGTVKKNEPRIKIFQAGSPPCIGTLVNGDPGDPYDNALVLINELKEYGVRDPIAVIETTILEGQLLIPPQR
jgi:hypothetical protein